MEEEEEVEDMGLGILMVEEQEEEDTQPRVPMEEEEMDKLVQAMEREIGDTVYRVDRGCDKSKYFTLPP